MDPFSHLLYAVDIPRFARRTGLEQLEPFQERLLNSPHTRLLLNCGRQSGKSTVVAVLALWVAVYESPALVLLVSRAEKQSKELLGKVRERLEGLPEEERPELESDSELRLKFRNGCRIVALPGAPATARSFSAPRLIAVDEAAQVDDALFVSLKPMLARGRGARLIYLSTPWGKRGEFYKTWRDGGPEWLKVRVRAEEVTMISREFLEEQRRSMAPWEYSQEFECEFADRGETLFPSHIVERILTSEVKSIWGSARTLAAA